MAEPLAADRADELRLERQLLLKAVADIEHGWRRLLAQENLVSELLAGGYDTREAERLALLFKQTLVEWERHRRLIEQRVTYLETCPFG